MTLLLFATASLAAPLRVDMLAGEQCARVVAYLDWDGRADMADARVQVVAESLTDCLGYVLFTDVEGNEAKWPLNAEGGDRLRPDGLRGMPVAHRLFVNFPTLLAAAPREGGTPQFAGLQAVVPIDSAESNASATMATYSVAQRYVVVVDPYVEENAVTHKVKRLTCGPKPCRVEEVATAFVWDRQRVARAARDGVPMEGAITAMSRIPIEAPGVDGAFALVFYDAPTAGGGGSDAERGDLLVQLSIPGYHYRAYIGIEQESQAIHQPNVLYLAVVFRGPPSAAVVDAPETTGTPAKRASAK